jgi:hypothetical protein
LKVVLIVLEAWLVMSESERGDRGGLFAITPTRIHDHPVIAYGIYSETQCFTVISISAPAIFAFAFVAQTTSRRHIPNRTAIPSTIPSPNPLSLPGLGNPSSRTVASESVLLGVGELNVLSVRRGLGCRLGEEGLRIRDKGRWKETGVWWA